MFEAPGEVGEDVATPSAGEAMVLEKALLAEPGKGKKGSREKPGKS